MAENQHRAFRVARSVRRQHEINLNGGIGGRKLVLELANDASGASGAVEAAKAAASDSAVLAFIGYSSSSRTQAAMPYIAEAGIPMITPTWGQPQPEWQQFLLSHLPKRHRARPGSGELREDPAGAVRPSHDRSLS